MGISIPKTEADYKKLSQFVMEFPQKIVDDNDEINGFIIIIDEFQMMRKIKQLDKFFWLIRSFNQTQHNVSCIFIGSISQSSELINDLNCDGGLLVEDCSKLQLIHLQKRKLNLISKKK